MFEWYVMVGWSYNRRGNGGVNSAVDSSHRVM
jgi:hypothetical protein